ncbi:hypothetical protein ACQKQA_05005 [Pseudomonas sp. NPDC089530]|uniref:hypothetical protein n=1 Tax=Pseudomonas sp. NPDC089530 TaxID=3390651 RepID=UPI003CFFEF0A
MFSYTPLLAGLALGLSAHAEGLDLSYQAPNLTEAPAKPATEPAPSRFRLEFKAPITIEHSCRGPQCNYETDPSQRHEPETVRTTSIGFN